MTTGAETRLFVGHANEVTSVAYSPDGNHVASGSFDGTIRLWDIASGAEAGRIEVDYGIVSSVAYSPDGSHVASGSAYFEPPFGFVYGTVQLWDVATGAETQRFERHTAVVTSVAYSPDGS
ncbi:MAG: hypothetical protein F4Z37_01465, partial [Rhodothermaceae bacterium]|nr:hypothetical protein [Rhodothermaceae bacterium]